MSEPTAEWHAAAVRWTTTRDAVVTPLHAHFSPSHLAYVVDEMRRRGQPQIKAYFDAVTGAWFALEGTHRLRAAKLLDVAPVMVSVPWPRSAKALDRARHAIGQRAHVFDTIEVVGV